MKNLIPIVTFLIGFISTTCSQNYTSYFTGNTIDTATTAYGGVCLMGGASEDDNAMTWFLQQANKGDILVLRASGSDGYNNYMYSELGVIVNSVETIVFNNSSASNELYIHQKIQQAEAIWFAGGDQWNYVSYWRNSSIDSLINIAIKDRNIVIGGTSAGMAIQGSFYFSAQNGTVTSTTALSNPFDNNICVDSTLFISNQYLSNVITDTHYDDPERKGRHVVFLSRILVDYGIKARGIACDEYTAVCIDTNGIAKVFGDYPNYDDNAYFIQLNCELTSNHPENCSHGNPLDWNLGNAAIKVYSAKGNNFGTNTFNLNDWISGNGGIWENWYVVDGVLNEQVGNQPHCQILYSEKINESKFFSLYPNPTSNKLNIQFSENQSSVCLELYDIYGKIVKKHKLNHLTSNSIETLNIGNFLNGTYILRIKTNNSQETHRVILTKRLINY